MIDRKIFHIMIGVLIFIGFISMFLCISLVKPATVACILFYFVSCNIIISMYMITNLENQRIWTLFYDIENVSFLWFLFVLCGFWLSYVIVILVYYLSLILNKLSNIKISDIVKNKGDD